jgi:hypothetical protein
MGVVKTALASVMVGTAIALGAVVAVGQSHDTQRAVRPEPDRAPRPSFRVFTEERGLEGLPAALRRSLHQMTSGSANSAGATTSRSIATPTGRGWVARIDHGICIAMPDPVDGWGIACTPPAVAQSQGALVMLGKGNRTSGALLLPDGAQANRARNGASVALTPDRDGVVRVEMHPGDALTVTDHSGHVSRINAPVAAPSAPIANAG